MNLNEMNFLLGSMEMYVTNEEEEKPITAHTKTLSIKVHGVDIYQSCIDGLLPQQMLNDNIVTMLIGYVIYSNYLSLTLPFFLHCSIFFSFL
jgi:hypothetical protein